MDNEEEKAIPAETKALTVFTLTVPLDRQRSKKATFYLKEIDEPTFLAGKAMISQGKNFDAVRMIIKTLSLPGSDSVELLKTNFQAIHSASDLILDVIQPLEGELKKNWTET